MTATDRRYRIRAARPRDLAELPSIERRAAQLFAGWEEIAVLHEVTSMEDFAAAQAAGRLWVAAADGEPVGFAIVEMLEDGLPHLEEIDVDPAHGRRGLGTALVRVVCDWAARSGYPELTLTTFRFVPWNLPFYLRLGFAIVPDSELRPALAAVVRHESERGLDPARRCAMRYRPDCAGPG